MLKKVVLSGVIFVLLVSLVFYRRNMTSDQQNVVVQKVTPSVEVTASLSSPNTDRKVEYDCRVGKTPFRILEEQFKIEYDRQDLGPMVNAINGYKVSGNEYWAFYIDGKMAPVGADSYQCQGQEKIEWKLEKF